jgi:cysteine-rich repeat protein
MKGGREPTVGATCGNSILEQGETCDDGNEEGGDVCSADRATLDPTFPISPLSPTTDKSVIWRRRSPLMAHGFTVSRRTLVSPFTRAIREIFWENYSSPMSIAAQTRFYDNSRHRVADSTSTWSVIAALESRLSPSTGRRRTGSFRPDVRSQRRSTGPRWLYVIDHPKKQPLMKL